jgi:hypothetical protein
MLSWRPLVYFSKTKERIFLKFRADFADVANLVEKYSVEKHSKPLLTTPCPLKEGKRLLLSIDPDYSNYWGWVLKQIR